MDASGLIDEKAIHGLEASSIKSSYDYIKGLKAKTVNSILA
jgi:hypothetical protein